MLAIVLCCTAQNLAYYALINAQIMLNIIFPSYHALLSKYLKQTVNSCLLKWIPQKDWSTLIEQSAH